MATLTRHTTYEAAEAALYDDAGIAGHRDHRVRLATLDCEVRVREVGDPDGEPVLFLHGNPNSGGTWAYLVAELEGFRCLLLDRPGTGQSEPLPATLTIDTAEAFARQLPIDVLDALGIDRAHVVASSFGGWIALLAAAAAPERFGRTVQLGCPGMVPGMVAPPFLRLLGSPLRHVLTRLPTTPVAQEMILRQIGHGASLDAGLLPQPFLDWYFALITLTDTQANELAAALPAVTWRGIRPELVLTDAQLRAVTSPTHVVWGLDDTFGDRGAAEHLVATMPSASAEYWPDSGHLPWLDDPVRAAKSITNHLRG